MKSLSEIIANKERGVPWRASQLVTCYHKRLIGRRVRTQPMGDWPGGDAEVIEVNPDPAAPEIVMLVRSAEHGEIGVFEYETVELLP